jgi:hypothetical protein
MGPDSFILDHEDANGNRWSTTHRSIARSYSRITPAPVGEVNTYSYLTAEDKLRLMQARRPGIQPKPKQTRRRRRKNR